MLYPAHVAQTYCCFGLCYELRLDLRDAQY